MSSNQKSEIVRTKSGPIYSEPETLCSSPAHISDSSSQLNVPTVVESPDNKIRVQHERLFLHDLLNSVGGLHGFLELMSENPDPVKIQKYIASSLELCDSLIEEIQSYRQITLAENGDLKVFKNDVNSLELLKSVTMKLENHDVSKGKTIDVSPNSQPVPVQTDKVLLSRILINLMKNALEATDVGGSVTIGSKMCDSKNKGQSGHRMGSGAGCDCKGSHVSGDCYPVDFIRFWVHNDSEISEDSKPYIFKKQFSTKGENRGLGSYSVQLLGEQYLGGKVGFVSNKEEGTTFFIDLPVRIPDEKN
ncbi:HAMP domain-containing sensor histidine kinase [Methanolapillus millepedarum]|uniref:Histidine kinase domain-containing protein n=1 Tax=Methanolapillus millepedarum TaxID=3028296 RepID=A0AA96ZTH9_9EURY|nr:hypothetical protein MsAc7_01420 [Methanosarcinaceae archaeon Ac7]